MAFAWGGTTRVYRTDRLSVFAEEDAENWGYADGVRDQVIEGVWLYFQIESNVLQRVSPASATDNDWIDVKNALIAGTAVTFYPIYSVDNTVSYTVLSDQSGRAPLLETNRALFKPSAVMNLKAKTRQADYPAWLRQGRHKP